MYSQYFCDNDVPLTKEVGLEQHVTGSGPASDSAQGSAAAQESASASVDATRINDRRNNPTIFRDVAILRADHSIVMTHP